MREARVSGDTGGDSMLVERLWFTSSGVVRRGATDDVPEYVAEPPAMPYSSSSSVLLPGVVWPDWCVPMVGAGGDIDARADRCSGDIDGDDSACGDVCGIAGAVGGDITPAGSGGGGGIACACCAACAFACSAGLMATLRVANGVPDALSLPDGVARPGSLVVSDGGGRPTGGGAVCSSPYSFAVLALVGVGSGGGGGDTGGTDGAEGTGGGGTWTSSGGGGGGSVCALPDWLFVRFRNAGGLMVM